MTATWTLLDLAGAVALPAAEVVAATQARAPAREGFGTCASATRSWTNCASTRTTPNKHTAEQITLLERVLAEFGWTNPMGMAGGVLVYGHTRR